MHNQTSSGKGADRGWLRLLDEVHASANPRDNRTGLRLGILQALRAAIDAASQVPQLLKERFVLLNDDRPDPPGAAGRCFLEPELPAAIRVEFVQNRSDRL